LQAKLRLGMDCPAQRDQVGKYVFGVVAPVSAD
jgi:hypothetical protein